MARDTRKELAERLKGWKLLPDGKIGYLPFLQSAVHPMGNLVALAIRSESRRKDQNDTRVEQFQFGLSPLQCRILAEQLLDCAASVERDMTPPNVKPN